jgi:hypothetical protein
MYLHPTYQFQMPERIFMRTWYVYHGTWAHLNGILDKYLPSICLSVNVSPLSLLGNGSVNTFPSARKKPNNRNIIGRMVFCVVRVVSKEILWISLCIPFSLLNNGLVTILSQQRKSVGSVVFYAVCFVWRERRRLVLPRTFCYYLKLTSFACGYFIKFNQAVD